MSLVRSPVHFPVLVMAQDNFRQTNNDFISFSGYCSALTLCHLRQLTQDQVNYEFTQSGARNPEDL